MLFNISMQEMEHMNMLHAATTDVIEKWRADHGDPPPEMMAVYDDLHEKQIDAAAKVKAMQAMYKAV